MSDLPKAISRAGITGIVIEAGQNPDAVLDEIVSRYNDYERTISLLSQANEALASAGFTPNQNGSWKPPLGKPMTPVLDSLDAEREAKNTLASLILELAGAALPHMPGDDHLRLSGINAINAALAVMEGRTP